MLRIGGQTAGPNGLKFQLVSNIKIIIIIIIVIVVVQLNPK